MLAAAGVIQIEASSGHSHLSLVDVPNSLQPIVDSAVTQHSDLLTLLTGEFAKIDLYGASGLKARTGLFEYRYDPA